VQVDSGALTQALWDVTSLGPTAYPSNMVFVRDYTIKLLETSFPNMTSTEVNKLRL
jgi:exportin-1